jgi:hypothetical protein
VGVVSAIFRNILGKPGAADFRDSAEHFVSVLRESGIAVTFAREELRYVDDLASRLGAHNEYRDALGCWLGEVLVRNFGGEWVPGHALGPAVRVVSADKGTRHLFPLGWVYRRADGGEAESIAAKLHRELAYPDPTDLGRFTDTGERA